MGSIMSFPVLCIVNAAICRWAMEVSDGRRLWLNECRLLINGDDCVFPITMKGREAWRRIASMSGMKESVGKCYYSKEFLNVNSTTFYLTEPYQFYDVQKISGQEQGVLRTNVWKLLQYVNLGLMNGMTRSTGGGKIKCDKAALFGGYDTIGSKAWQLKKLTPEFLWEEVYRRFLNRFRNSLNGEPIRVPWFIPTCFGGLGLPPPTDGKFWPKRWMDNRLARLVANGKFGDPRAYVAAANWKIHKQVLSQLPEKLIVVERDSAEAEMFSTSFDRLYGAKCVEQMFRGTLAELFESDPKPMGQYVLRQNERVWAKAYRDHSKNSLSLPEGTEEFDAWKEIPQVVSLIPCMLPTSSMLGHTLFVS